MVTTVRFIDLTRPQSSHPPQFVDGGCIYNEDQAKRVKYAYDKGHQVASHTWSHAHLNTLTWDQRKTVF